MMNKNKVNRVIETLAAVVVFGLFSVQAVQASTTHAFSDLNGAVFFDLPATGSNDPFGPQVFNVNGIDVGMTSKEYEPGSTTVVEESPALLGVFDKSGFGSFLAPIDPLVAPGDYAGEFETNANIVLNFDRALSSVGASFMADISIAQRGIRITAFSGLDNTGVSLGSVVSFDNPFLGEPRPLPGTDAPFIFIYFVGVQSNMANIQSMLIEPLDTAEGFALDGIALGTAAVVPVPAALWLFGSGLIALVSIAKRRRTV